MDDQRTLELTRRTEAVALPHALPLFQRGREGALTDPHMRPLGTGWLLMWRGSLFLVSAAHVFAEIGPRESQLDDLLVVRGPESDETPVPVSGRLIVHPDSTCDIAALSLDHDVVAKLEGFPLLAEEDLALDDGPDFEWRLVAGWPAELRPPTAARVENGVKRYSGSPLIVAGLVSKDELGPGGAQRDDYLYLEFDLNELVPTDGPAAPRDLKGISGAAMWAFRPDNSGNLRAQVVGIETDVIPRGPSRFVRATPVRHLLQMLSESAKG